LDVVFEYLLIYPRRQTPDKKKTCFVNNK